MVQKRKTRKLEINQGLPGTVQFKVTISFDYYFQILLVYEI